MKILLVLNNTEIQNLRVMVRLTKKRVIRQVIDLLEQDRPREVFDLVVREGQVVDCLPSEDPAGDLPEVTLFEDRL